MSRWRLGFGGKWLCLDIFLRILKVGRTIHITWCNFWRKCLCLGEFTRLSVYWVVYQNVLHFYIILCLIKCWSLWVVMYNFNFMFKSVRWICDALETTGYCSRLLAIHCRLLLLFCDMLNVLIDCILKVLDFLVLFLGIKLHFYTCAVYRGSDTRIQCQH